MVGSFNSDLEIQSIAQVLPRGKTEKSDGRLLWEEGDVSRTTEAWKEISKTTKVLVILFTTLYRFKAFVSLGD